MNTLTIASHPILLMIIHRTADNFNLIIFSSSVERSRWMTPYVSSYPIAPFANERRDLKADSESVSCIFLALGKVNVEQ